MTQKYRILEEKHPKVWEKLVSDRRVPAKSGSWIYDVNGKFSYLEVPQVFRSNIEIPEGIDLDSATFSPCDDWSMIDFEEGIKNPFKNKKMKLLGHEGDRELFARYEMHKGGLLQHATGETLPDLNSKEKFHEATTHLGVPDILVTNYSMLEYSLLRPLEHIWKKLRIGFLRG